MNATYLNRNCSNKSNFITIQSLGIRHMLFRTRWVVVFGFGVSFDERLCCEVYHMSKAPARWSVVGNKNKRKAAPDLMLLCIKFFPSLLHYPFGKFNHHPIVICHIIRGDASDLNECKSGKEKKYNNTLCAIPRQSTILKSACPRRRPL